MLKRIILTALLIGVIAMIANDAWRYADSVRKLRGVTHELALWAADNAREMSRDSVSAAVTSAGARQGVTVYMYDQDESGIKIWTQAEVDHTVVLSTAANMLQGKSVTEARKSPMIVRDYREAGTK